jgi:mono/diheme cytochrome c family protein
MIAWLRDPRKLEEHAVMPRLFSEGATADAEIYAVATYLSSLGGPVQGTIEGGNPNERRASAARGERLFNTVGCVVCHGQESKVYSLGAHLGAKTTLPQLSRFLQNPLETHPAGRMPNMRLNGQEANDLARFLLQDPRPLGGARVPDRREANALHARLEERPDRRAAFEKIADADAWKQLGEQLSLAKRCDACHRIEPQGRASPRRDAAAFKAIRQPAALARGCLADDPSPASVPRFNLNGEDRKAIRSYLASVPDGPRPHAPIHETSATLQRFQCQACHQRYGQGGLDPVLVEQLRKFESAENAEAVSPPPLTGTGGKLTKSWLQRVLSEGGQARPWMGLRMPQFGAANLAHLPAGLQASEGIDDALPLGDHLTSFVPSPTEADVEAGRKLVGKKAFGCIGCHDIAGVPSSGTRGPDLAAMNQRVRYDWYRRWLVQPQRMQPGTRMPTVFNEGRSLLDDVLQGDAGKQADAMWTYLSLGPTLPLPEGLEPPKGLVLAAKDRPVLLRTFMPDAGSRAIAVGFPKQVSVAYDAAQCRLAYAWSGNFLDASPTWNDRGGNPAKVLGARFWEARRVFPWFFLPQDETPDVPRQAADPAFGAGPPEGRAYAGPWKLSFEGYRARPSTHEPTFLTQVSLADGSTALIEETVTPRRSTAGVGVQREFALKASTTNSAWLLLGEASRPKFLTQGGTVLSLPADAAEAPGSAYAVVLDGTGGRPNLTVINSAPDGARLRLVKSGSTTFVFLQMPAGQVSIAVTHWQPYRTDDRQLAELLQEK